MSTDEPTPDELTPDELTPDELTPDTPAPDGPGPVQGVRKSAAVHTHPVADPEAWRTASLPDPVAPKPNPDPAATDDEAQP